MRPKKKNKFFRVSVWVLLILLLNLLTLLILLQVPAVQTRLAQYVSRDISAKTGFEITINQVDISWLDRFNLKGLKVNDEENQELLSVETLKINYNLGAILKRSFRLDGVTVSGLDFTLKLHSSDTLNLTVLINRLKKLSNQSGGNSTLPFGLKYLDIYNSNFYYQLGADSLPKSKFNPRYFSLLNINANLEALQVRTDTFLVNITNLAATEGNTNTEIKNFHTEYMISSTNMKFTSLDTNLGRSKLSGNLEFKYQNYAELSSFIDKVNISAVIKESEVSSTELSLFSSYFDKISDRYKINGEFKGEITDFHIRNLDLRLGNGTKIIGRAYFSGLPNISETFIDLGLKNSTVFEDDLEQYIPSTAFTTYNRFHRVGLNGSFTGYVQDFVAYGEFKTNLGTITSDINLKIGQDQTNTAYSGRLKLTDFELGEYTSNDILGKISLSGSIKGKGFTQTNADFSFNGNISKLEAKGYTYSGIAINGKFKKEYYSGSLAIDDPNLKLHTENEIDLRNNVQRLIINGELELARPDILNLTPSLSMVRSKIEANIQGFKLDSVQGYVNLADFRAENQEEELDVDFVTLHSVISEKGRELELITDKSNIKAYGNFNFSNSYTDLMFMVNEFKLSLLNNADSLNAFYAKSSLNTDIDPYQIQIEAKFSNIDRLLNLFDPNLSLHSVTTIDALFKRGTSNTLSVAMLNDSISYHGNTFINNILTLDASKIINQQKILASADFQSEQQNLGNGAILYDLILSAVWADNKIDFNWYNLQPSIDNTNDLYGEVTFYNDSTEIHFNRSQLTLLNEDWTIQDSNLITIKGSTIEVENLNVGSKDQMLTVSGVIGKDPGEILSITANNLDLSSLNSLLPKKISGFLSGEFSLSNLYSKPTVASNFYVNGFYINQFLVGDIYSSNDWSNNRSMFDVQFIVSRNNNPMILVSGVINPLDTERTLDLRAAFMNTRINMLEPFVETLFSDIKGNINGKLHITGALNAPVISGAGTIHKAGLNVNYLNTYYDATGTWKFDSSAIYLQNLVITDKNNNVGLLNGRFTHNGFREFNIDLRGTMKDFLVLNTTSKQNDLFYGVGVVSGNVSFIGPLEDITIKAQATSERGTRFFIPIGGTNSTEFEDYISFVNFTDTLNMANQEPEEDVKITGLTLDFDLDITEEAYTEIIFDITSGDIIRGRGNGNISLNIDTKGEFSMLGSYEFVSGGYNFTMYNIVNKEFEIKPKSKITWSGDPYGGLMDIDAAYKLSTSLAPLVDSIYWDLPDVRRIYPTEVLLNLAGPLLTPDIDFDIIIDEYPKSNVDLDTQVKGFLNTIAVDQQELNRQVFSLLILRKFSPPNSFSSSGTIGSSVSEFVSNQLSYWISQVDDNLTIDMDLGNLDADALNTFQLRVSYEFLDGKLVVTRDGGFTDPNNDASVESIAGDWTLEYLLSDDGKLRAKLFNKTNYNQLNSATGSASQALISGGFSLIYTTSFDRFSDLFKRNSKKNSKNDEKPSNNPPPAAPRDENQEMIPE